MNDKFERFAKSGTLQLTLTLAGVVVTLLNIYIASKLAPVAQDISSLAGRVVAIEKRNDHVDPLVTEFIGIKEIVKGMDKKIDSLEGKVDRLIENR